MDRDGTDEIIVASGSTLTVLKSDGTRLAGIWPIVGGDFQDFSAPVVADIDLVQTSCGFGVPMFDYAGERDIHFDWAEKKGAEGLQQYMKENNLTSLDALPTNLGLQFS